MRHPAPVSPGLRGLVARASKLVTTRAGEGVLAALVLYGAQGAGCGAHEGDCRLNPYACTEGGGGGSAGAGGDTCAGDACCAAAIECGPCEQCAPGGGCEPVELASNGECDPKMTCGADLQCRKKNGEPCLLGSECASGACGGTPAACMLCASDADCAASGQSPECHGGWCKRPDGATCLTDLQCLGGRCVAGACAPCTADEDCASGACDEEEAACQLAVGQPCAQDADCAGNKCSGASVCAVP